MHILPDLKEIENEFSIEDGLVVVSTLIYYNLLLYIIFRIF